MFEVGTLTQKSKLRNTKRFKIYTPPVVTTEFFTVEPSNCNKVASRTVRPVRGIPPQARKSVKMQNKYLRGYFGETLRACFLGLGSSTRTSKHTTEVLSSMPLDRTDQIQFPSRASVTHTGQPESTKFLSTSQA